MKEIFVYGRDKNPDVYNSKNKETSVFSIIIYDEWRLIEKPLARRLMKSLSGFKKEKHGDQIKFIKTDHWKGTIKFKKVDEDNSNFLLVKCWKEVSVGGWEWALN